MCNIFSYQGNADQSHNDVLFTLSRMAKIKKTEYNKCGPRLGATETLLHWYWEFQMIIHFGKQFDNFLLC